MQISKDVVQYVANLAQLQLDDAQSVAMVDELSQILGYIEALEGIDTEGIAPLTHLYETTNIMRPDVVTASLDRARLLQNAPDCTEEAFVVPRTVG